MKELIKSARQKKGMMLRELAQGLGIDQALVSKFESGARKPSRALLPKLAKLLSIDEKELRKAWLTDKILHELADEELALEVLIAAEQELKTYGKNAEPVVYPNSLQKVIDRIDELQAKLKRFRQFDSYRIAQALELEYTFESNRIEGNTLTLKETDLVINEGLTISGKSMREHLEAINHKDAIILMKELAESNLQLTERDVLCLHQLVLRGIDTANAGKYRGVQVMIKGSNYLPPAPFLVPKQMEDFIFWYMQHKTRLHPVVLAAELHERLVSIHPFIDGNGRTSRLLMNLILLQYGYVIANIKGDNKSRMAYYNALEEAQVKGDKQSFILLVAKYELAAIERYVKILDRR